MKKFKIFNLILAIILVMNQMAFFVVADFVTATTEEMFAHI